MNAKFEGKRQKKCDTERKARNPRVFFSYDWENVWRANQLKNQSELDQNKKASFVNKSLKEKSKAQNEDYIKRKIREGIDPAGTVVIVNSPTFEGRKFTTYEQEYAIKKHKKMIVINSEKMKDKDGQQGVRATKPELCKEYHIPSTTYEPGESKLKDLILKAKKPAKTKRRGT